MPTGIDQVESGAESLPRGVADAFGLIGLSDFKTWEPKHPFLLVDRKYCSHKFKHGGMRYGIALSIFTQHCVWVSKAYPAGTSDIEIFEDGLEKMMKDYKLGLADGGYGGHKKISIPNPMDDKQTHNFKSRARLRQETFNGRLKHFAILRDTYRHDLSHHRDVVAALCVTVQVQMDNGTHLFDV